MQFIQKEFGQRVRSQRKVLHMTQERLARQIRVAEQHVGRIERGERAPSIDILIGISAALDISTDFLLTGEKPDNKIRAEIDAIAARLYEIAKTI